MSIAERNPLLRPARRRLQTGTPTKGEVLKKSRLVSVAAVLAVLDATATALVSSSTTTQVKTRKTSALGTFLVDGKGRTLYLFGKDRHGDDGGGGGAGPTGPTGSGGYYPPPPGYKP
jgi:hypothetical protein